MNLAHQAYVARRVLKFGFVYNVCVQDLSNHSTFGQISDLVLVLNFLSKKKFRTSQINYR